MSPFPCFIIQSKVGPAKITDLRRSWKTGWLYEDFTMRNCGAALEAVEGGFEGGLGGGE